MRKLTLLSLASITLTLAACSSGTWRWVPRFNTAIGNNVTNNADYQIGYVPGATYETLQPLLMTKPEGWNGPIHLVGFSTRPGEPTVIDLYEDNPDSYDHVRGILPAGTRIEIEDLIYYGPTTEEIDDDEDEGKDSDTDENEAEASDDDEDIVITQPAHVEVRGEILNGEFEGKTVVLDKASRQDDFPRKSIGYTPDRQLIRKIGE